jgi:uncharacterized lipoprotein YmbA
MRNTSLHLLAAWTLGVIVVILSGCASSPSSKFYQLNAMSAQTGEARNASDQGGMIVVIGPLRIPDYLDRPQIVTRSGKNELKLAEFDRWAGSVENDIIRVLVGDISAQLPPERFFVMRWTPLIESRLSPAYRVEIVVNRFEGTLGGDVTMKTQWGIFTRAKGLLFPKETVIVEHTNGGGYVEYVAAMSRAVERMSKEIADGILSGTAMQSSEVKKENGG